MDQGDAVLVLNDIKHRKKVQVGNNNIESGILAVAGRGQEAETKLQTIIQSETDHEVELDIAEDIDGAINTGARVPNLLELGQHRHLIEELKMMVGHHGGDEILVLGNIPIPTKGLQDLHGSQRRLPKKNWTLTLWKTLSDHYLHVKNLRCAYKSEVEGLLLQQMDFPWTHTLQKIMIPPWMLG